jgi:3-oxoacyl-[acyl-carrier protein] reductase
MPAASYATPRSTPSSIERAVAEGLLPEKRWATPGNLGRVVAALARGGFSYAAGPALEISGGVNVRRL